MAPAQWYCLEVVPSKYTYPALQTYVHVTFPRTELQILGALDTDGKVSLKHTSAEIIKDNISSYQITEQYCLVT